MATKGTVSGVIANMVTLVVDGPVAQNEICYISTGGDRLMAEVIKVVGTQVYVQVFEIPKGERPNGSFTQWSVTVHQNQVITVVSLLLLSFGQLKSFSERMFL